MTSQPLGTVPSPIGRLTVEYLGEEYHDVVSYYQEYDLETEDLLYGDDLVDGMVVLAVDRTDEERLYADKTPDTRQGLIIKNRWCRVSSFRAEGNAIFFIGIYAEGRKRIRMSLSKEGWIVKKDSVPVKEPFEVDGKTYHPIQ